MSKPKILLFDLETSPNILYSWRIGYNVNLNASNLIEERKIIMSGYKWKGEKETHCVDWGLKAQDDVRVLKRMAKEINKADLLVGHNIDGFDMKWLRGRVIQAGLPPLKPVKTLDTLKMARKLGYFNSNRLDYLGEYFGLGRKLDTGGFQLWKDVLAGKKSALNTMTKYCVQDVDLLEKVLNYLEPHILSETATHIGDPRVCRNTQCNSTSYQRRGYTVANTPKRILVCNDCGTSRRIGKSQWRKYLPVDQF